MVRGKDEQNLALRLATRAGKMALSCPHGITHRVSRENSVVFGQACSVKMAGYWFCFFYCMSAVLTASGISKPDNAVRGYSYG